MKKIIAYTDGASRGNPGIAGIGVVLLNDEGNTVKEISRHIGTATNNVAEYTALIAALQEALEMGSEHIQIFADSELMVKQIKGIYKVKNEGLKPLYADARSLLGEFASYEISHVRREYNQQADKLANLGIDEELGKSDDA